MASPLFGFCQTTSCWLVLEALPKKTILSGCSHSGITSRSGWCARIAAAFFSKGHIAVPGYYFHGSEGVLTDEPTVNQSVANPQANNKSIL